MDGELLIFLLDIASDDEINEDGEITTDLAEDNADVA